MKLLQGTNVISFWTLEQAILYVQNTLFEMLIITLMKKPAFELRICS